MKVVFHKDFYQVYTSDPAAEPGRLEAVMDVIEPHVELVRPEPALEEDIAAVHGAPQIERVKAQGLYSIASLAAGGAILASELGLSEPAFALIRPPGHHASRDSCWGFCYFNNMAIALDRLQRKGKIQKAYVLDFDLHFGDGTVNILGSKDWVTIFNPDAANRDAYVKEVAEDMERCDADMIGISAGFDNHEMDWGGTLRTEDYEEMGRMVRQASRRVGGGCFGILEGGYNHRVLGQNVMALIQGLSVV
ncbi:MAG: histone deacetylase family protein [Thermodesulfobacteriota bacterium]